MHQKVISINGETFAYRESGRGDPLVLVHANISDLRSWAPLESPLAEHFRVINYSRRFAYPNRPPEDGGDDGLPQHAADLITLIETLRLGKVHVVGNSSGAFAALLAAQRRPDLVRSLTLEEPPVVSMFLRALPPGPLEMLKLLFTSPAALFALARFGAGVIGPATQAFRRGDDVAAVEIFARGVLGERAFAQITEERRRQMLDNAKAHRATLLGAGLPVFTAADAAGIRMPVQLLRGANTPGFQQRINQRLAEFIPGASDVVIPDASHLVHEDNPHAVALAIRSFCNAY